MLRSSVQYTTHPTFKTIREAPITRQSKEKMSHHPFQRRRFSHSSVLPSNLLYPISGMRDNYVVERNIVMRNIVDYSRTGWKKLQSLLNLALQKNDEDLVNAILRSKLPFSVLDDDRNDRTLWFALQMGDVETATNLVCAGTDLNRRHPGTGATYLHWLASKIDEKYHTLALLMMDYRADVNATDKKDNSVLHVAAEFGLPGLVEELIKRHANIDIVNKSGHSVVYAAANNSRAVDMMQLLIGYSKDAVTRNKRCIDAFYALVDLNANNRQIKILLDMGFPLDQYGRKGCTLLYEAVSDKKIDLVKLLLEYGADVNKKLRNSKLPIHAAAQQKDSKIVKLLIEKGASVHDCSDDYNGQYPIHGACKHESLPNIKLLLQLGADVNVIDKSGRTPFSLVSSENFSDLQSYIIKHLAITMAKENIVNRSDLMKIRASLDMQVHYEKCLVELQTMKETNICDNIPFFYIFDRSVIDLLSMVKVDFMKIPDDFRSKWKDLFPVYSKEIYHLSRQIDQMKVFINQKAQIVREISNNILPYVVVDLIAFYACLDEIKQMQQNYYFSFINE